MLQRSVSLYLFAILLSWWQPLVVKASDPTHFNFGQLIFLVLPDVALQLPSPLGVLEPILQLDLLFGDLSDPTLPQFDAGISLLLVLPLGPILTLSQYLGIQMGHA